MYFIATEICLIVSKIDVVVDLGGGLLCPSRIRAPFRPKGSP